MISSNWLPGRARPLRLSKRFAWLGHFCPNRSFPERRDRNPGLLLSKAFRKGGFFLCAFSNQFSVRQTSERKSIVYAVPYPTTSQNQGRMGHPQLCSFDVAERKVASPPVIGYVVMPEHIHLLIGECDHATPATMMRVLKQRFARRVLGDQRRCKNSLQGSLWQEAQDSRHVWQRRYYDFVVRTEDKGGEAQIHSSQSSEARAGARTRSVGVEQLSVVCSRRARAGAGQ